MKIGQVAEATGTTTKTLRFYEAEGLIPPAGRTASGYRDYTEDILDRIDFIHRGQAAGLTLAHIKQILKIRDHGQTPCSHVRELLGLRLTELDSQITELLALRETISRLYTQAAEPEPESCPEDEICRYL